LLSREGEAGDGLEVGVDLRDIELGDAHRCTSALSTTRVTLLVIAA